MVKWFRMNEMEIEDEQLTMTGMAIPLAAVFTPLLLWPIELWLPYPAFVEEIAKLILVVLVVKNVPQKSQLTMVLICGGMFVITETILYVLNAANYGSLGVLVPRLLLTAPMHMVTFLILWRAVRERLWWAGLSIAICLHGGFNWLAGKGS